MTLPEAVHRLTETWTLVLTPKEAGTYRAQDFPARLVMLQNMIAPSKNTSGGGGDVSSRNVLDVTALDLLMHIEDVTRSWLTRWAVPVTRTLTVDVRAFWERLDALHRSGGITEQEHTNLSRYPEQWATRIWDLIEPPTQIPLRGVTCPLCGRDKWVNDDDELSPALLVSYRDGGVVVAECRWRSCTFAAVGDRALLELGYHAGATVDSDVLKEMGIS